MSWIYMKLFKQKRELEELQRDVQQRIQEKQKKLQELEQAVNSLKRCAQTAVEDTERIWTELICSIEKKRSELTELIRAQEEAELSAAEELLEKLEQEIADLKRRNTELEQLSLTEDHIHFLQSFQSLSVSSGSEDSSSISVHHHLSFDGVRSALSDLKERLEEFCREEFRKIPPQAAADPLSLSEPKSREDFLQYFCQLTLNPNTAHHQLILSESNRVVKWSHVVQSYSDHPERFDCRSQVLSVESLSGRCYWEVKQNGPVKISVSYKKISRKGRGDECLFGHNDQSWSLCFSSSLFSLSFWHNKSKTKLPAALSSTIGVYVDHSAGILSFYSVSDTMTLLHTVHSTFTQPLYAGFWVSGGSSVKLCDKNDGVDCG
ncbi:tripartite motif-containing protein 16-like [Colossoma macropomum]|uniref:tripartite motif-containing protein 16-like n=1 Tax=Colossoma macropomum TaxID=42526 RepID=UPI0018655786|nr:tripartite motif-containing protein 16-like [Colossoma macropomum]